MSRASFTISFFLGLAPYLAITLGYILTPTDGRGGLPGAFDYAIAIAPYFKAAGIASILGILVGIVGITACKSQGKPIVGALLLTIISGLPVLAGLALVLLR